MIDLDRELTAYGREWRAVQPPLPPRVVESVPAPGRRPRRPLVAAALVLAFVVALGAVVVVVTRSEHTPPTIEAPPTTRDGFVPKLDVVPLYLPIDAADVYSVGDLAQRVVPRTTGASPTHDEIVQSRACDVALIGEGGGNTFGFEDPGSFRGTPMAPTVAPPDPPATLRCTEAAARAAARIRSITQTFGWHERLTPLDADPSISDAIAQDIQCMHDHGIDRVTADGYVTDGFNMAHPDQIGQTRLTFADCFAPVVAARAPIRSAFRDSFIADHRGEITNLQRAFDDYLREIYTPAPHAKTVTTEPDLARFDRGCIRVTNPNGAPVSFTSDAALAIAHGALGDANAPVSQTRLGRVTVCDRRSIRGRGAWVFEFPGEVVVVDATSGKVILRRTVADG